METQNGLNTEQFHDSLSISDRSEINLINCEKWTSLGCDNPCRDEDQGVNISGIRGFITLIFQWLIPNVSNFVNSFNKPKGKFWTSGWSSSPGFGLLVPNEVLPNQKCPSSPSPGTQNCKAAIQRCSGGWRHGRGPPTAVAACGEGTGTEED